MGGEAGNGHEAKDKGKRSAKRKQVEVADGWTIVTHSARSKGTAVSIMSTENRAGSTLSLPTQTVRGMTAQKLLVEFKTLQKKWIDTPLARQIVELLRQRNWSVTDAVCIAIGSFSRDWIHRWRSLWQLVLFIAVMDKLEQQREDQDDTSSSATTDMSITAASTSATVKGEEKRKIEAWAQDPAFNDVDVEFLSLLHISVLPTAIEQRISPTSFLFSPFIDWFLLLPTFLCISGETPAATEASLASMIVRDPELYIGNEVLDDYAVYAHTEEKRGVVGVCDRAGTAFLRTREKVKLGEEKEDREEGLRGLVWYVKKVQEKE